MICFLPIYGVEGWYVLSDYPLNKQEFDDMADNGKVVAYFQGVDSAFRCTEVPLQIHCPYWSKEPVEDLLVTPAMHHLAQQLADLKAELVSKSHALDDALEGHTSAEQHNTCNQPQGSAGWLQKCARLVGAYIMEDWVSAGRSCAEYANHTGLWSRVMEMQNSQG